MRHRKDPQFSSPEAPILVLFFLLNRTTIEHSLTYILRLLDLSSQIPVPIPLTDPINIILCTTRGLVSWFQVPKTKSHDFINECVGQLIRREQSLKRVSININFRDLNSYQLPQGVFNDSQNYLQTVDAFFRLIR